MLDENRRSSTDVSACQSSPKLSVVDPEISVSHTHQGEYTSRRCYLTETLTVVDGQKGTEREREREIARSNAISPQSVLSKDPSSHRESFYNSSLKEYSLLFIWPSHCEQPSHNNREGVRCAILSLPNSKQLTLYVCARKLHTLHIGFLQCTFEFP